MTAIETDIDVQIAFDVTAPPSPQVLRESSSAMVKAIRRAREALVREADRVAEEHRTLTTKASSLAKQRRELEERSGELDRKSGSLSEVAEDLDRQRAELSAAQKRLEQDAAGAAERKAQLDRQRSVLREQEAALTQKQNEPDSRPVDERAPEPVAPASSPKPGAGPAADQFRKLRRDAKRKSIGV